MKNFSEWFHNILEDAELMDARYPVKGMSVWLPRGFKIRKYSLELLQKLLVGVPQLPHFEQVQ